MDRFSRSLSIILLAFLLLVACDGGTGPDGDADNLIGPEGGTVTSGALTLDVPAGALDEPVKITVTPLVDAEGAAPAGFLVLGGTGFDLQPDGLRFNEAATLSIHIADAPLPAGVSLPELRLLRLDGEGASLPSELDQGQEVVTGTIEHFSSFGVGLATQFSRVACPNLTLAEASGMPLDRVAAGRLPQDFEPPVLVVATAAGDTIRSYGVVDLNNAGEATMVVPIHPSADPAGGGVQITVSDGTRSCAAGDFTITPLPEAPGEMAAVVDLLQDVVRLQAAELDATPEELIDIPVDQLPSVLIPLAVTQSVIDHPENDHSLRAIVEGRSPEAADAHLDLLEPLLARTRFRSALAATVAAAEAPAPVADAALTGTLASITPGLCSPDHVVNAEFLDYCMGIAASAAFEGPPDEVLDGLSEGMLYGALVPGLGTATAVGGALIWVAQTQDKRNASLLPSLLTRMELEADPVEFFEDQEGPGSWHASVYATNQGYDLGKEFLEGALQGTGVASVATKAQIAGPEVGHLTGWVLTGPVAEKLLEGGTLEEFLVQAETYQVVQGWDDDKWAESRIVGDAFSKASHQEYNPETHGKATLSVRTEDGKFGGQQVAAHQELRVKRIQMTVSPDEVYLSADKSQTFRFEVINAKYPERVDVVDEGALQGTVGTRTYSDGGVHTVEYTAPSDPDPDITDLLVMEHMATTGARSGSSERRLATAKIRFGKVRITPRSACVPNGDVQTFTADVPGPGDLTVRWEIESGGGSLSATTDTSVEYIAPSEGSGTATLRAYLEQHPDNDDRVTFRYGACSLALYYGVGTGIDFPFSPGGVCENPDLDRSYKELTIPEEMISPWEEPLPGDIWMDRTETLTHTVSESGALGGTPTGDPADCVTASFAAEGSYRAVFTGSADATRVDLDVDTSGESNCVYMGETFGTQCSSATTAVAVMARFDFDITEATDYVLTISLSCDYYRPLGVPADNVNVTTFRVEPDGTPVPSNSTTEPIQLECGFTNPTVDLQHVFEFAAPAESGQTDHVMVVFQAKNHIASVGGPVTGYIKGFVSVEKQP